jgi:uncharacterized membrane protein YgcG
MAPDWREQAYYEALTAALLSGSQDYDRAVLTLSSGTLALSATFIHDIAPTPVGDSIILLILSWAALVLALSLTVISFQTSQWAMNRELTGGTATRLTKVTVALNVAAGIGLLGGIVLFAYFALVNL